MLQRGHPGCCPGFLFPGSQLCAQGRRNAVMVGIRPLGPPPVSASRYVAEHGCLPKDWDRAASPLSVNFPPLPFLVSTSSGGICDLVTRGAPPLPRTAPVFADGPLVKPNADSLSNVASNLVAPPDRAAARAEIRVPPVTPKPPPPAYVPSDNENAQTTDVPSDYQSD